MILPLALCTPVGEDAVLSIEAPCRGPIKQAAHCVRFLLTQAHGVEHDTLVCV